MASPPIVTVASKATCARWREPRLLRLKLYRANSVFGTSLNTNVQHDKLTSCQDQSSIFVDWFFTDKRPTRSNYKQSLLLKTNRDRA